VGWARRPEQAIHAVGVEDVIELRDRGRIDTPLGLGGQTTEAAFDLPLEGVRLTPGFTLRRRFPLTNCRTTNY
jgi:hypothetical protein